VTGYKPSPAQRDEDVLPALFERAELNENSALAGRLPPELGREIWAISAEDHYINVITPNGTEMTLYRFSDALKDLPEATGFRVHRSHWVSRKALSALKREGKKTFAVLPNGQTLPVSSRYLEVLRFNGFEVS